MDFFSKVATIYPFGEQKKNTKEEKQKINIENPQISLLETKEKVFSFFTEVGEKIITVFEEEKVLYLEEQKRIQEKEAKRRVLEPDNNVAPWENLPTDDSKIIEQVTVQILEIAKHPRNLIDVPPDVSSHFPFTLTNHLAAAKQALDKDPQLSKLRYSLVPKRLSETQFWRNYFYRVHMIKTSYQLASTTPAAAAAAAVAAAPEAAVVVESDASARKTDSAGTTTMVMGTTTTSSTTLNTEIDCSDKQGDTKSDTTKMLQKKQVSDLGDSEEEDHNNKAGFEFASEYYDEQNESDEGLLDWKASMKGTLHLPGLEPGSDDDDLDLEDLSEALKSRPKLVDDEDDD